MTVFHNFQTERLSVNIITTLGATAHANLDQVLAPSVTQFLPPDAQLAQFSGDIDAWLRHQQGQGATLMLASCDGVGVGLVMLHNGGGGEVMIGYMFAQSAWGKGYASELVLGLVAMLRSAGFKYSFGGVADQNPASARVLEKAGFEAISNQGVTKMYRLSVGGVKMHRFSCRVYYEDTDLAGIVYYANYLKFIERARSEWVRDLGVDQNQIKEQGIVFAVRRVEADYITPARFDDLLDVETTVVSKTAARLVLDQSVLCGDRPLFKAKVTLVAIGLDGRPTRLPPVLQALDV